MADTNRSPQDVDLEAENIEEVGDKFEYPPLGPDIGEFLLELPEEVKRRVKALKKLQLEVTKIEGKFYEEMHALECKYTELYQPYFEKRESITTGRYEPADDECEYGSDTECDVNDVLVKKFEATAVSPSTEQEQVKKEKVAGIPKFWLKIFHQVDMLSELMETYDDPIIEHLEDIKVQVSDKPMGFTLFFHFSPNEYFTNTVLTKTYVMKCEVDPDDPFAFEGPEIVKCSGCTIDWNKGKNVTVKVIRKKQKHKQRGSIRTVSKTVNEKSFFNFFTPPTVADELECDMDEETQMRLTNDFEVGQYIRERIVPRAVLFFTGEALDDDFEEEEEGDDNEEEEEDDDDGEVPQPPGNRGQRTRKGQAQKNPPECKQQ